MVGEIDRVAASDGEHEPDNETEDRELDAAERPSPTRRVAHQGAGAVGEHDADDRLGDRLPDPDGIAATRHVLAVSPGVKIVILTTFEQDDYVFGAINAGASGFLLKRTRPEEPQSIPSLPAMRSITMRVTEGDRSA